MALYEPRVLAEVGGRWVPAIPAKAPLGVRLRCSHRWTPVVHEHGTSWLDYGCIVCGALVERPATPKDGPRRGILVRLARMVWR